MRYKIIFDFFAVNVAFSFSNLNFSEPVSVQRILKNSPEAILNDNCKCKYLS